VAKISGNYDKLWRGLKITFIHCKFLFPSTPFRYLISTVNKKVIFLPPNMADTITNPDLISILIDNLNSIFVIEDAENIVIDREKDGHSPVTAVSGNYKCRKSVNKDARFFASLISDYKDTTF
jgi:hypothetical protein